MSAATTTGAARVEFAAATARRADRMMPVIALGTEIRS